MLTEEEEAALMNYIGYMSKQGFPMNRSMVRQFVTSVCRKDDRVTLFNMEKGPSDKWFRKFSTNHPELTEREPEMQDRGRTRMANQTVMNQYFKTLAETLDKLGLANKPGQIFNCDETGWSGKEKSRQKFFGFRGQHCYQQKILGTGHITAHLCISADGKVMPSFLIFEKCFPHTTYKDGVPNNWMYAYSDSGYMDTELFLIWFRDLFIPNCGSERPVVLIMDNHDSHINIDIVKLARENSIELVGLPPHTTHILQPLDVHINGPLKAKFSSLATSLGFINKHQALNKAKFPVVLSHSIDQLCSPATVKESFRKTGIYPYNPDAIDKTQLTPSQHFSIPSSISEPAPSTSETTSSNIQPTSTSICTECGTFLGGNPLVKEGLVPQYLADIFQPVPAKPYIARRKLVTESRVITSDQFLKKLEEKVEDERIKKEVTAKRKRDREEKKQQKLEEKKSKKARGEKRKGRNVYKCKVCNLSDPENTEGDTLWIQCETCDVWFHPECVGLSADELEDEAFSFKCMPCLEAGEE